MSGTKSIDNDDSKRPLLYVILFVILAEFSHPVLPEELVSALHLRDNLVQYTCSHLSAVNNLVIKIRKGSIGP